ncbi:Timeless protein [Ostreococcus tauri]|uniref:Timeless protein n=1 Tax=Ostreococcus tauri TaxID=70448 RepID=Q01EF3_OSTTA|nr:Timeless protein [Ostreococcus tauri]CAL52300.2 Timeless protein [Ostreococcus tauri]|eukprot:XP_003075028.1 Timeless protein [Ostreococcus tauri]
MSQYSESHLLSLVSTIGARAAGSRYRKDTDCEVSLQDIIRFLQKDNNERRVFLQLTAWNVLAKDLIPLLLSEDDVNVCVLVLKLLVFHTLPPEKDSSSFLEQVRALNLSARALLDNPVIFPKIMHLVSQALQTIETRRLVATDVEAKMLQLVLTFIRNLLLVSTSSTGFEATNLDSVDETCKILSECKFLQVLATILQDVRLSPFKAEIPILVEIFELILNADKGNSAWYRMRPVSDQHPGHARATRPDRQKFGVSKEQLSRFSAVYVRRSQYVVSEKIIRGMRKESSGSRPVRARGGSALSPTWLSDFSESLHSAAVNQFLLIAWEDLKRGRQQMGLSVEYSIRLSCFARLCSHFVGSSYSKVLNHARNEQRTISADYVATIANILSTDFVTWIRCEWLELEQSKLFSECVPLVELLACIAQLLTELQNWNQDERIRFASRPIRYEFLNEDTKYGLICFLRSQLKNFKWSGMPANYLASLFTLLSEMSNLSSLSSTLSSTYEQVIGETSDQLNDIFMDCTIFMNHLRLTQLFHPKNYAEASCRARFLNRVDPSTSLRLSALTSLQLLRMNFHEGIASASSNLLEKTIQLLNGEAYGNNGAEGSVFVKLLVDHS